MNTHTVTGQQNKECYTRLSTFDLERELFVKLLVLLDDEGALGLWVVVASIQHSLRASSAQLFQALKRSLTWGGGDAQIKHF